GGDHVAAAAQFGLGNPAEDGEGLAESAARGRVYRVHNAEILGQEAVSGIAARQRAQHLQDTGLAGRNLFERVRITYDHVGKVRSVQVTIIALQKNAADLFNHAIKVVDPRQAHGLAQGGAEIAGTDRLFLKLLPAAAVNEDAIGKVESGID